MAIVIQELQRNLIEPDPTNPRQIFDEVQLQELAEDLHVRGMLQPIVVRKHPKKSGRYMIVFGERRWRASENVLELVPCIIREMSDVDVLEAQIAENNKRSDVHPLEEADAYRRLHDDHGRDIDEIAAICGKSKAYVYAQMKLCALGAESRKAFLEGKLDKSRALLIARLPKEHQKEALSRIASDDPDDPVSYRDAAHYIRNNFMLALAKAPFKLGDGLLVAEAGPCTTCPKKTGNQQELFADVCSEKGGKELCTDSKCYQGKVDAHWQRMKNEAEARGQEVLEGKAADEAGAYGSKKFIDLDRPAYELGESDKTYRQLLGKHAEPTVVARDEQGTIKELIPRADLPALLKDAGIKKPKEKDWRTGKDKDDDYKERNEREKLVTRAVVEAVLSQLDGTDMMAMMRLIARMTVRVCRNDAHRVVLTANSLAATKESSPKQTLLLYINQELKNPAALRNFVVELLMAETRGWLDEEERGLEDGPEDEAERAEWMSNLDDAAKVLGIDVKAIVKKVRADMVTAAKDKAEKKQAPKKSNGVPAAEAQS